MFPTLVRPLPLGRIRSLLLLLEADLWGPDWLLRWLDQDDPQRSLAIRVIRSILRQPERWTESVYGLTNGTDGFGVWTAEGYQSAAIAVDGDKQFYPGAYWRWMLNRAVRCHREWAAKQKAKTATERLFSDEKLAPALREVAEPS
jgi:hypothetical protein